VYELDEDVDDSEHVEPFKTDALTFQSFAARCLYSLVLSGESDDASYGFSATTIFHAAKTNMFIQLLDA